MILHKIKFIFTIFTVKFLKIFIFNKNQSLTYAMHRKYTLKYLFKYIIFSKVFKRICMLTTSILFSFITTRVGERERLHLSKYLFKLLYQKYSSIGFIIMPQSLTINHMLQSFDYSDPLMTTASAIKGSFKFNLFVQALT